MGASAQDLTDELLAGMPEGFVDLLDPADPDGPGPLFSALGEVLCERGTDRVEQLRLELSPLTCSSATLAQWEIALGVGLSRIALAGSVDLRRRQVLSRLRQWGVATLALVRAVVYTYLGYASTADVRILEVSRSDLRALHTYTWTGTASFGGGTTTTQAITVNDDPKVSRGGVQLDLTFQSLDLATLGPVTLTGPGAQQRTWGRGSIGRHTDTTVRLYWPEAEGTDILGTWTVSVAKSGGALNLTRADLFAEGEGLYTDFAGKKWNGRGSQIFLWGPIVEPQLQVLDFDLDAGHLEVLRLCYACRGGDLLLRALATNIAGLGDLDAIVDDDWCLADAAVPG